MNLDEQVCTLEQARLLKTLGIRQDVSYAAWLKNNCQDETEFWCWPVISPGVSHQGYSSPAKYCLEGFSAFTVAELAVMLPDYYPSWRFKKDEKSQERLWIVTVICGPKPPGIDDIHTAHEFDRHGKTQAEALATLLIALLETETITPAEVNERLK
jgi:hypothetical protein